MVVHDCQKTLLERYRIMAMHEQHTKLSLSLMVVSRSSLFLMYNRTCLAIRPSLGGRGNRETAHVQ